VLKEREAFNASIDEKWAKFGHHANSGKKRKHHKKSAASAGEAAAKPPAKPKA
jgi:hypothetical protein